MLPFYLISFHHISISKYSITHLFFVFPRKKGSHQPNEKKKWNKHIVHSITPTKVITFLTSNNNNTIAFATLINYKHNCIIQEGITGNMMVFTLLIAPLCCYSFFLNLILTTRMKVLWPQMNQDLCKQENDLYRSKMYKLRIGPLKKGRTSMKIKNYVLLLIGRNSKF